MQHLSLISNTVHVKEHLLKKVPLVLKLGQVAMPESEVAAERWNPLSKTVLSKYSFIGNKGPVNIWHDHKAQMCFLIFGIVTMKYFLKYMLYLSSLLRYKDPIILVWVPILYDLCQCVSD